MYLSTCICTSGQAILKPLCGFFETLLLQNDASARIKKISFPHNTRIKGNCKK